MKPPRTIAEQTASAVRGAVFVGIFLTLALQLIITAIYFFRKRLKKRRGSEVKYHQAGQATASLIDSFVSHKVKTVWRCAPTVIMFPAIVVLLIASSVISVGDIGPFGSRPAAPTEMIGFSGVLDSEFGRAVIWTLFWAILWIAFLQIDILLIQFRVDMGLFGLNAAEATELIEFAEKSSLDGGGGWRRIAPQPVDTNDHVDIPGVVRP